MDGRSSEDALTQFCEDLSIPIEELTNIVYLAIRSGPDTSDSRRYLLVAENPRWGPGDSAGPLQTKSRLDANRGTQTPGR